MITRAGVTVLEVLVVLVVVVLTLGLAIMFLLHLRESGQRVQCENNLKRIAEAVRQYHDASAGNDKRSRLPPSRIADGYATWAVLVVPHLIKETALEDWDKGLPYIAQKDEVRGAALVPYFCPARLRTETLSTAGDLDRAKTHVPGALGDYAAVAGNGDPAHDWTTANANGAMILAHVLEKKDDRIIAWQSLTSLADITRGESVTLLLGEKHVPEEYFGDAAFGDGSLYNGARPASFSRVAGPGFPIASSVDAPVQKNFGSFHRGGPCPFVRVDTSKQWITPDVSEFVLGKIATRGE